MKIDKLQEGECLILTLEGWLDTQSSPILEEALNTIPEGTQEMVIDMKSCEYIASSGVRLLVAAHKKMDGHLTVRNVCPEIMDILNMTGVSKRIKIE